MRYNPLTCAASLFEMLCVDAFNISVSGHSNACQACQFVSGFVIAERSAVCTICLALSSTSSYVSKRLAWSTVRQIISLILRPSLIGSFFARCSAPGMQAADRPSSMVITTSCSLTGRSTSSVSGSFAKRASATVAGYPCPPLVCRLHHLVQPPPNSATPPYHPRAAATPADRQLFAALWHVHQHLTAWIPERQRSSSWPLPFSHAWLASSPAAIPTPGEQPVRPSTPGVCLTVGTHKTRSVDRSTLAASGSPRRAVDRGPLQNVG